MDGTGLRSTNVLDLKNPFFRYTGLPQQPPPGTNTQSPTETYWNSASVVLNGGIMNTSTAYAGQPQHGSGMCFGTLIMIKLPISWDIGPVIFNRGDLGTSQDILTGKNES